MATLIQSEMYKVLVTKGQTRPGISQGMKVLSYASSLFWNKGADQWNKVNPSAFLSASSELHVDYSEEKPQMYLGLTFLCPPCKGQQCLSHVVEMRAPLKPWSYSVFRPI